MTDTDVTGQPVFIVGMQRSGTTMLRFMLNAHPRIAIPFESDFIPKFYKKLGEYGDLGCATNMQRLLSDISAQPFVKRGNLVRSCSAVLERNPRSYSGLIASMYGVYAEHEGKQRWGDKDPDYISEIDVLWKLFPDCRIIHIVRDGRGVANSLRKLTWGSKNILRIAHRWSWQSTLGHKMGVVIGPKHFMEVRYEDLVAAPESCLRRICEFVEEPFDEQMLHYYERAADALPNASLQYHTNSVRPPDISKVTAWQHEMAISDQILFEEEAGDTLKLFGYECTARRNSWGGKIRGLKYTFMNRW